jgi:hypothetical protein
MITFSTMYGIKECPNLISSHTFIVNALLGVTVVPKYLKFVTFSKGLLAVMLL